MEGERGRGGAYFLRPGFRLPPMMFNEEEALGLVLALLAARGRGLSGAGRRRRFWVSPARSGTARRS